VKRREFMTLLGGTVVAWPLAARTQQSATPVIGFLHGTSAEGSVSLTEAFRKGLSEVGFVEGKTITIEYRWANGQYEQLPALAADLVRRQVDVIATGTPVAAIAAKRATASIPIVFALGSDPVKDGLVVSLSHPGGNITGATFFSNLLDAKRLELLHELVPGAHVVALILNPKNANAELETRETQEAAQALGMQLVLLQAINEREIDEAFGRLAEQHVAALLISGDALFTTQRQQIANLSASYGIPTSGPNREQAVSGALMSYGASYDETYRQAGIYVGRILKGEKAADLPVIQPTKFVFVINMKRAKTLGLAIPNSVQLLADEVIE
jgi:putative ABC transport system substrate-binding protein